MSNQRYVNINSDATNKCEIVRFTDMFQKRLTTLPYALCPLPRTQLMKVELVTEQTEMILRSTDFWCEFSVIAQAAKYGNKAQSAEPNFKAVEH